MAEVRTFLELVIPGEHVGEKVEAHVRAAGNDNVENGGATNYKMDDLCKVLCVDRGTTFLLWEWDNNATEALRKHGCKLCTTRDKSSFALTQQQGFKDTKAAGLRMDVIGFIG